MNTVAARFAATAERHAARPFLLVLAETAAAYGIAAGVMTYAEAAARIGVLRDAYGAAGYGGGHRIGLMVENRPAFFLHWLALNALGASVVPLSPDLRPAECDYLVRHSDIVLGVAAAPHVAALRAVAPGLTVVEDAADRFPPAPTAGSGAAPGRQDECALLYTSGTTGRPKGCVLSNHYYLHAGDWYAALDGLGALREGDRLLTPLPLGHINAMAYSSMAMIATGGCIVQLDRFHPRSWWDAVRDSGATIIHYLGVMPSMLLGAAPDPRDREHAVRFAFGAGVDPRHHATFEARFGFPLLEAWAMTETGAGAVSIANRAPRHVGTACFGRPGPGIEVRIAPEDGAFMVRAAGPDPRAGFFTAYLKDPAETAAAWQDGWFQTGDIVRQDGEGNLYFVDRKKNIVRRSGENVSAAEVESVLRRHPAIAEVAVAAAHDELRGEEVLACVVLRTPVDHVLRAPVDHVLRTPGDDAAAIAADIVRAALAELSYFKVPGWVVFMDALPLTGSQKVARGALKAMVPSLLGGPGCVDTRALKRR